LPFGLHLQPLAPFASWLIPPQVVQPPHCWHAAAGYFSDFKTISKRKKQKQKHHYQYRQTGGGGESNPAKSARNSEEITGAFIHAPPVA